MGNIFTPEGSVPIPGPVKVNDSIGNRIVKRYSGTDDVSVTGHKFNLNKFFESIAHNESNKDYTALGDVITNRKSVHYGTRAWGKYQFMPKTLQSLGYNMSRQEFLSNPKIQEEAMRKLTMQNARSLGITDLQSMSQRQAKALSMAHYAGVKKAKAFLTSGPGVIHYKTQRTTNFKMPSMMNYANNIVGYMKGANVIVDKASYVFDKLKNK